MDIYLGPQYVSLGSVATKIRCTFEETFFAISEAVSLTSFAFHIERKGKQKLYRGSMPEMYNQQVWNANIHRRFLDKTFFFGMKKSHRMC